MDACLSLLIVVVVVVVTSSLHSMKGIRIPNAALLDVYGRPAAVNNHDLHRASLLIHHPRIVHPEKNGANNHPDTNNKNPTATNVPPKVDTSERLSVIGKSRNFALADVPAGEWRLGETPLHIAIVYNDIKSVKLLVKHGVDVNKRVTGDYNTTGQERIKDESIKGKRQATRTLFQRNQSSAKQFNPQSENPESTHTHTSSWLFRVRQRFVDALQVMLTTVNILWHSLLHSAIRRSMISWSIAALIRICKTAMAIQFYTCWSFGMEWWDELCEPGKSLIRTSMCF